MKKLTRQNRIYIAKRSRKELIKKKEISDTKKARNKRYLKVKRKERQQIREIEQAKSYIAPSIFVLRENPEQVISYLENIKAHRNPYRMIYINLSKVEKITQGAIAMLLSVLKAVSKYKIKIIGNKPRNAEAKKILESSGFFSHVFGAIEKDNYNTANTIVTRGRNNVEPEKSAAIVQSAMKCIKGIQYRNQAIQGMLIELMANSINHAFPDRILKEWVLSVSHHDTEKKVSFSFVDNGVGIIDTLRLTFKQHIAHVFKGNDDLLLTAFKGQIGSRTGLKYRGKGLPSILKKFNKKKFSNLVVITNDVFLDFETNKFVVLNSSFNGTYYYWELAESNIQ
jgi:hypothetical protein